MPALKEIDNIFDMERHWIRGILRDRELLRDHGYAKYRLGYRKDNMNEGEIWLTRLMWGQYEIMGLQDLRNID